MADALVQEVSWEIPWKEKNDPTNGWKIKKNPFFKELRYRNKDLELDF